MQDRDAAAVGIEERRHFDVLAALADTDAIGVGEDEAAGMAQHVIFDVAGDCAGRRVDGDHTTAVGAAAVMRPVLWIEREVPRQ